ncbi:MAG TPA: DUF6065 family protein, partial [Sphingomonas sp.]|nr:DUF6065 family protein [Sphingomonas sp.]
AQYRAWITSRDAFQEHVRRTNPTAPADQWQKLYYRGVRPDGERGVPDHEAKLRLAPFAPATDSAPPAASATAAPGAVCPAHPAAKPAPSILTTHSPAAPGLIPSDTLARTLRTIGFDAEPEPRKPRR